MSSSSADTSPFTLYYATYSVCATMVRTTFAFRGKPKTGKPEMNWQPKLIDIGTDKQEQMSEYYLCKVNPEGLVPALVNDVLLEKPMPESVDITWYLSSWYPDLLPPQHEQTIRDLMNELHRINYFAITFNVNAPVYLDKTQGNIEKILKRDDISDEYRKALEYKNQAYTKRRNTVTPEQVKENGEKARSLLDKIDALKTKSGSDYIFGPQPTALDAHVLVFLRRLLDLGRHELVPEPLQKWADDFAQSKIWKEVVPGGTTLPPYVR